jgi:hypothetical protein
MRTIRLHSWGEDVCDWQGALNDAATGRDLTCDGIFGPLTQARTRDWQASRGLKPDGVVGPLSQAAMWASPIPGPTPPQPSGDAIRQRIADVARSVCNHEAWRGSPTRDDMIALCDKARDPRTGRVTEWDWDRPFSLGPPARGVSCCVIAQTGIYRRAGCLDSRVTRGSHDIGGGSPLYAAALAASCWCRPGPDVRPGVGDAIMIERFGHVRTLVGWDGDVAISVDGGQVDPAHGGLQCVREARRRWGKVGGVWREVERVTLGWVSASGLRWG